MQRQISGRLPARASSAHGTRSAFPALAVPAWARACVRLKNLWASKLKREAVFVSISARDPLHLVAESVDTDSWMEREGGRG